MPVSVCMFVSECVSHSADFIANAMFKIRTSSFNASTYGKVLVKI